MKDIEWTAASLDDMAGLDKGTARRVQNAVERFVQTGAGNVKKLHGIDPPEYRLRSAIFVYGLEFGDETILILRVLNRRDAYR